MSHFADAGMEADGIEGFAFVDTEEKFRFIE